MKRFGPAALVASLLAGSHPAQADGGPMAPIDPKRTIAVFEYRGGSAQLADVGARVTAILRNRTGLTVASAAEVRARLPELDARLSACAGDDVCVARVGARAQVAEVLLVGVAEFGDVILTLQRVDVGQGRVVTRVAEALEPGTTPSDATLGGYLQRVLPASDFRRFGRLRIAADLAGAHVSVAGKPRGQTPLRPLRVSAPAAYDILVEKHGYKDFRASVEVPPDGQVVVRVDLVEIHSRSWYSRWWVLALAGTAVAGGLTAAVLLSRSDSDEVPVTIRPF